MPEARDPAWLDYQEQIGLRHTPAKKNATDDVERPDVVPLRYIWAFAGPVILGAREFLAKKATARRYRPHAAGLDEECAADAHAMGAAVGARWVVVAPRERCGRSPGQARGR
ncbi:MAG TPA: hypothetical protein VGG57_08265 [Stellaceae bacterium]|jgi:hypothetical protein